MTQQNICLACGRVISGDEPGICNVCAEFATEVSFPVLVRQVVPEASVINPEDLKEVWQCQATSRDGRLFTSTHSTQQAAEESAANCRGRYPYGNRVKVVRLEGVKS